jgi:hypothetical protein
MQKDEDDIEDEEEGEGDVEQTKLPSKEVVC